MRGRRPALAVTGTRATPHSDGEHLPKRGGGVVTLLETMARNAGLARRLSESNQRLEKVAETDALTLLLDRRGLDLHLQQHDQHAINARTGLSLLDVDHFKRSNDLYGHLSGDECLRRIAGALRSATRGSQDIAARHGGEEFALILPGTGEPGALAMAQRALAAVEGLELRHSGSAHGRVTVSTGVACLGPDAGFHPADLVRCADEALYRAKRLGRNRIAGVAETADSEARALF